MTGTATHVDEDTLAYCDAYTGAEAQPFEPKNASTSNVPSAQDTVTNTAQ